MCYVISFSHIRSPDLRLATPPGAHDAAAALRSGDSCCAGDELPLPSSGQSSSCRACMIRPVRIHSCMPSMPIQLLWANHFAAVDMGLVGDVQNIAPAEYALVWCFTVWYSFVPHFTLTTSVMHTVPCQSFSSTSDLTSRRTTQRYSVTMRVDISCLIDPPTLYRIMDVSRGCG